MTQIVGQFDYYEFHYSSVSGQASDWYDLVEIDVITRQGMYVEDTTVTLNAFCLEACKPDYLYLPPQPAEPDSPTASLAFEIGIPTVAPDETIGAQTRTQVYFENPAWWGPSNPIVTDAPGVRCDNALKDYRVPGCAFVGYAPTLEYSEEDLPDLADHIRDAQALGLPGAPDDRPLHRTQDQIRIEKNRNASCPQSIPRPPGMECDEYPFASTYEGGLTGEYSRRMIPEAQNRDGGTALLQFYRAKRILDHDSFYVTII